MLTLLYGCDDYKAEPGIDMRPYLCHKGIRSSYIREMKVRLRAPRFAPHHREIDRDVAKLQLINVLSPTLMKKVMGVEDRRTGDIKMRDQTVVDTLDKKLQLNLAIIQASQCWRRKRFESRLIKHLDDWTVLCTDVNRIIAKFAIMD